LFLAARGHSPTAARLTCVWQPLAAPAVTGAAARGAPSRPSARCRQTAGARSPPASTGSATQCAVFAPKLIHKQRITTHVPAPATVSRCTPLSWLPLLLGTPALHPRSCNACIRSAAWMQSAWPDVAVTAEKGHGLCCSAFRHSTLKQLRFMRTVVYFAPREDSAKPQPPAGEQQRLTLFLSCRISGTVDSYDWSNPQDQEEASRLIEQWSLPLDSVPNQEAAWQLASSRPVVVRGAAAGWEATQRRSVPWLEQQGFEGRVMVAPSLQFPFCEPGLAEMLVQAKGADCPKSKPTTHLWVLYSLFLCTNCHCIWSCLLLRTCVNTATESKCACWHPLLDVWTCPPCCGCHGYSLVCVCCHHYV
jgi:hypothetical protein